MHPLASQLNRMLTETTSQLSAEDRRELEVVLRRVMLAFKLTPGKG
ncbi:hypothetical protein [Micromonospora sp. WMMD736]